MRLLALLRFRDEARRLPGYFANVAPQVDGIIALDDGSIDGSAELAAREPKVIELLSRPREAGFDEVGQRRILTQAGIRHEGDWLLGLDADERLERRAGQRIRARIEEDGGGADDAYALPICELWDRPDAFRVDGIWGRKARTTLFRAGGEHRYDERPLHGQWASVSGTPFGSHPRIDARIYHLAMLRPEDRSRRRARYSELDPDRRWQRIGYDYLTDEAGLELRRIEPGRGYEEVIPREGWGTLVPGARFEPGNDPGRLILHHTALTDPGLVEASLDAEASYMRRIERFHLDRAWAAVGYHFVIMPSGRVFEGRPLWAVGAHAIGHNRVTAGIALAGNFEEERPQRVALSALEAIRRRLSPGPQPIELLPHRELMPTECPGRHLCAALDARPLARPPGAAHR